MYGFYVLFHMPFHGCIIVTAITFGDVPIEHVNRYCFKFSSTTKVLQLFCTKIKFAKIIAKGCYIISSLSWGKLISFPLPKSAVKGEKTLVEANQFGSELRVGGSFYQGSLWYSLVNSLVFFKYLIQSSS